MSEYICDLEANGLNDWKDGSPPATVIWCGVFKNTETNEVYRYSPENLVGFTAGEAVQKFMEINVDKVVGHNFVDYDIELLNRVQNYKYEGDVFDTYIGSQMGCPDRVGKHGLDNWGKIVGRYKPAHEDWSRFSLAMLHRCVEDVEINHLAYEIMKEELVDSVKDIGQGWALPLKIEHSFAVDLVEQKKNGFLVDRKLIHRHIATLDRYIANIDRVTLPLLPLRSVATGTWKKGIGEYVPVKPFTKGGDYSESHKKWMEAIFDGTDPRASGMYTRVSQVPFDLGSAAQIKTYLLAQGWVPDEWNFSKKTGKLTSPKLSADDNFVGVNGKMGRIIAKRMKYTHRRSQLAGFIKLIRPDGRITAGVSGICPTVRLRHTGIVNIPGENAVFGRQMRSVFIAKEGYRIVGCDAASCQLRMLCHYMGDDEYTEAVVNGDSKKGTDAHSVNMRLAGCKNRGDAKTLIYAILFGAGDKNLAAQLQCSVKAARKMRKRFMDGLPKLKALVDRLKKVWKKKGYITALDGRKIFVRSEHMLLVYLLQSAEAIMMKVSTLFANKWCAKYDAKMVAHVHDESQWEVLEKDSITVGELLEKSIVKAGEYLNLGVPMAGEAKIGINWWETH